MHGLRTPKGPSQRREKERQVDPVYCLVSEIIHYHSSFSLEASHEGQPMFKGKGISLYILLEKCQRICELVLKLQWYHEPCLSSSFSISTLGDRVSCWQKYGRSMCCQIHPSLHNVAFTSFQDLFPLLIALCGHRASLLSQAQNFPAQLTHTPPHLHPGH